MSGDVFPLPPIGVNGQGKVYLLYAFTPLYFPFPINVIFPDLFCKKMQ